MFWILMGALAALMIRNHFEMEGVKKDVRRIARKVRKIVRELAGTIREAAREAKKESGETRKAEPAQEIPADSVPAVQPAQAETQENNELLKELEQKARSAAMLANVPTLDFPKDDPKYDSTRKYMYA